MMCIEIIKLGAGDNEAGYVLYWSTLLKEARLWDC